MSGFTWKNNVSLGEKPKSFKARCAEARTEQYKQWFREANAGISKSALGPLPKSATARKRARQREEMLAAAKAVMEQNAKMAQAAGFPGVAPPAATAPPGLVKADVAEASTALPPPPLLLSATEGAPVAPAAALAASAPIAAAITPAAAAAAAAAATQVAAINAQISTLLQQLTAAQTAIAHVPNLALLAAAPAAPVAPTSTEQQQRLNLDLLSQAVASREQEQ